MKKVIVLIAALLAALFVVGCKTAAPAAPAGPSASELMASARGGAPMGVMVGQGTASSQRQAEQNAANRLKRGLGYIAEQLVDAQVQSGRLAASVSGDLKSTMNAALENVSISAQRVDSGADSTGRGWAVYSLDKASALQAVTAAANAAKEKVAAGNFNPSNGFDDAYAKAAAMEWK